MVDLHGRRRPLAAHEARSSSPSTGPAAMPVSTTQPFVPSLSTCSVRSRRRMSLRVSQPLRSTSFHAWPYRSRSYPVLGARPLTGSNVAVASAVWGCAAATTAASADGAGSGVGSAAACSSSVGVAVALGVLVGVALGVDGTSSGTAVSRRSCHGRGDDQRDERPGEDRRRAAATHRSAEPGAPAHERVQRGDAHVEARDQEDPRPARRQSQQGHDEQADHAGDPGRLPSRPPGRRLVRGVADAVIVPPRVARRSCHAGSIGARLPVRDGRRSRTAGDLSHVLDTGEDACGPQPWGCHGPDPHGARERRLRPPALGAHRHRPADVRHLPRGLPADRRRPARARRGRPADDRRVARRASRSASCSSARSPTPSAGADRCSARSASTCSRPSGSPWWTTSPPSPRCGSCRASRPPPGWCCRSRSSGTGTRGSPSPR